jgi:hypothetical protein
MLYTWQAIALPDGLSHIAQSSSLAQPFLQIGGGVLTFTDSLLSLPLPDFQAHYDIRPSQTVPVIRDRGNGTEGALKC